MEHSECREINVEQARELLLEKNVCFVDIRTPEAFDEGHIAGAVRVDDLNIKDFLADCDRGKPLVCYCYHGYSSRAAARFFEERGFREVYSMVGGFTAWIAAFPGEYQSREERT